MEPQAIRTIVPISDEDMLKSFKEKTYFIIEVKGSELKNESLLYFLSNSEIDFELDLEGLTYEEKANLLKAYLTLERTCQCDVLDNLMFEQVFSFKGLVESTEFTKKFNIENKELMERICLFLDSVLIFIMSSIQIEGKFPYREKVLKEYEHIKDRRFIGIPVANILLRPEMFSYFSTTPEKMYYFDLQFEERLFSGSTLHKYVFNEQNMLPHLILFMVECLTNKEPQ